MDEKIIANQKRITEAEMVALLEAGTLKFPPLNILPEPIKVGSEIAARPDAFVTVGWENRRYPFVVECKPISTPKAFQEALSSVLWLSKRLTPRFPMVMVPYLSKQRLDQLLENGVSGIDLCGNGVVVVAGQLLVYRTGASNKYPQSFPIRNVYVGKSSMVARAFLLQPEYSSVNQVRQAVAACGAGIAISTVSKVLRRLEDDLIIDRDGAGIRLLQPDILLDKLTENYGPPIVKERRGGKSFGGAEELLRLLSGPAEKKGLRFALTGASSVRRYAVMAGREKTGVYCTSLSDLWRDASSLVDENSRFPDVEFMETVQDVVYFDVRERDGLPWASPIQTYLELMHGDKRDRETAEQVRQAILAELADR